MHDVLDGLGEIGIKADWIDPTEPEFADTIRGYDVAFINCHGDFGEDGTLQGLLTYLGVPYTGSSVATSAIAADKRLTKLSLSDSGVELPEYHRLSLGSGQEFARIHTPVMLKSVNGGSSVGMELVTAPDQFKDSLTRIQENGFGDVIAESFIEGVSVTVPVIHVSGLGIMLPPVVCESQREYYDEYSKLSGDQEGAVSYRALTDPDDQRIALLHDAVRKVAGTLDFDGAMRVDFIMREGGRPVLLEVNTLPGVQQGSNLMLSAEAAGLDYPTVLGVVLASAQRARLAPWMRRLQGVL